MKSILAWVVLLFFGGIVHPVLAATPTNLPPTISGTPTMSVVSNSAYNFTPTASDPEGAKLTFSIAKKPSWAAFNTTTGALTGNPASTKAGSYAGIVISVSDGKNKVSLPPFTMTVTNPAPTLNGTPPTQALVNVVYSFKPEAQDPNGDVLKFSIVNKPKWATFDTKTGLLTGKPAATYVNKTTKRIVISVTEGKNKVSLQAFDLTVLANLPNKLPVIGGNPATSINAGQEYAFIPTASDADNDVLTFSINKKPDWATFDTASGKLSGIPSGYASKTSGIIISVTDGKSSAVSLPAFNIVVGPINVAREFGVATQGKDYDDASQAFLAMDGNTATFNHTTCDAMNNWWQVKLPNATAVEKVIIGNRAGQAGRLVGAKVYLSSVPYNGTLNDGDTLGSPLTSATTQTIAVSPAKSGAYLIVKAASDQCLHMTEVEVYGQASVTPALDASAYHFQLSHRAAMGQLLGKVKAVDYQWDDIQYALTGAAVPFAIDAQGSITVSGTLQAGMTYNLTVSASDGVNHVTAPVTVVVTSSSSVEDALRTGDASVATSEELLDATIAALASQKATPSLLTALYGTNAIAYTPGHNTQLIDLNPWVDSASPILLGAKGNTLAMAGNTATARYAAFGAPPTDLFKSSQSLEFEAPFGRLLAWLLAGEPVDSAILNNSRTVALSMTSSGSRSNFKTWIAQKYPSWTIVDCNSVASMAGCYSTVSLVVTDGGSSSNNDAATIKQVLADVMAAGKPVLYLHTGGWGANDVAQAVASLMRFSLPYGGNWWADDAANWTNVTAMQSAIWDKQGLAGIETMLNHFKADDYAQTGLDTEFYLGANKVRAVMTSLDESKVNLFQNNESRLYRLLALLGDSYRQGVVFPMDKDSTNASVFLKSLFADHAIYNYRTLNPVQPDMGNFSRSDFRHITPVTKTVAMTSRQNFRAAGVYALPGKTFRVTRNDNSSTTTKVFINSLRSGSTHEFEAWGYKRPKFLQSAHVPLKSGETITLTSPYGGPIQIDFGTNDQAVSFTFEQVGEHPFWDDTSDNAGFSAKLAAGEYDWAEFVTPAFEIHSTLEKMRESASDTRWGGTLEGFAAATMRYTHNFPHVLAGFKGPGIDVVPEIHDFATAHSYIIENLDMVKHMNADQATCGYGCSGNPYDAYWSFEPIGHGDIHELGHGLQSGRISFVGWENHAMTNPYSYYTKTQFVKDRLLAGDALASIAPDCQSLPFQKAFGVLQASRKQANPAAYVKANLWTGFAWSDSAAMLIQTMMAAEDQGALQDGWHLLSRLHIMEREFNRARKDTTTWDSKKASLGFVTYSLTEANAINNNDWLLITMSYALQRDMRSYFDMWAMPYTADKAGAQVAALATANNYPVMPLNFYISSTQGYCKGEGFDGNKLPVDGNQVWPLAGAQSRSMGDSFR